MIEPINLMERFGDRYRITWDGAYDPKHRPKDKLDPMETPCERGTIYPDSDTHLNVMIDYRPITAKRVAEIPGVELAQDGDVPVPGRVDQVAELVKPHRKRQYTDEERRRLAEQLQQNLNKSRIIDAPTSA